MYKTEENFIKALKSGLCMETEAFECDIDDLEHLALTHICVPFVYRGAVNAGNVVSDEWKNYVTVSLLRNQKNLQVQSMILDILKKANVPCSVIKGSTVAVNYPEPMMRTLGDIDVLVNVADYEKTIELLCGDKYENEAAEDHQFHYKYTIQGVSVEIHKHVTEYSDNEYGKKIESIMAKALDKTALKQIDEFVFPSLTNEYMAATLLLHTQRHFFENRLPIRMLCDWAMFVKSVELSEWNALVYPFVSQMGLDAICDGLTATCNTYLGIGCEDKVKSHIDDKTCEILIEEFLNCGVIRDEDSWSESMASSYSQKRNATNGKIMPLVLILNDIARHDFAIARKSVLFLPLCWIFIAIRYLFRRITGKRDKVSFKAFNATAERKDFLINKLNLKD